MSGVPVAPKLLIDEDLSPAVAQRLRDEDGIDAVAVRDRGRLGATDNDVLEYAFTEDRILVTFDKDFGELAFRSGLPASSGIVLFRISVSNPMSAVNGVLRTAPMVSRDVTFQRTPKFMLKPSNA